MTDDDELVSELSIQVFNAVDNHGVGEIREDSPVTGDGAVRDWEWKYR